MRHQTTRTPLPNCSGQPLIGVRWKACPFRQMAFLQSWESGAKVIFTTGLPQPRNGFAEIASREGLSSYATELRQVSNGTSGSNPTRSGDLQREPLLR